MVLDSAPDAIAKLMAAFRAGDSRAGGQLIELLYPELKRLAAGHLLRERKEHSWQPTLLVNELYLQLVKGGYLLDSGDPYSLWFGFGLALGVNDLIQRNGLDCDGLLRQAEKEFAAAL